MKDPTSRLKSSYRTPSANVSESDCIKPATWLVIFPTGLSSS